jgi:hypothetical protein
LPALGSARQKIASFFNCSGNFLKHHPGLGITLALTVFVKFIAFSAISILLSVFASASDLATQVRDELNLARTAPKQYAQIIATRMVGYHGIEGPSVINEAVRFLEKARPLPPLAFSDGICSSALTHVLDLGPSGGRGHVGSDRTMPWDRMARFGQWSGQAGENIYYGQRDARGIVIALIVDDGDRGRGHRKNIFSTAFHYAGIACGRHASFGTICVIDFAGGFVEGGTRMAHPVASL